MRITKFTHEVFTKRSSAQSAFCGKWDRPQVGMAAAIAAGLAALVAPSALAGTYTLITPYSGAGTTTGVNGINDAGYTTGVIGNADGSSSGFVRSPTGTYTPFTVAGPNGFDTYGRAINNSNVVTGYSTDSSGAVSTATEYKRNPGGTITVLTNPNDGTPLNGIAGGINSSGKIVGDHFFVSGGLNYRHGYLLDGASFTDISAEAPNTDKTQARGISDTGTIVGFEVNRMTGVTRGFVDIGNMFNFVNDPSASNASTTYLEAINNHGIASGEWADASGSLHPFVYNIANGHFSELSAPVTGSYFAFGLNNLGQVILAGQTNGMNYLYNPASSIPEPASLALMIAGLGAMATALRPRRKLAFATA